MKNFAVAIVILSFFSGHAFAHSNAVSVCGTNLSQSRLKVAYPELRASDFVRELNERAQVEGTASKIVKSCAHSIAGQFAVVFTDADGRNSAMLFNRP